MIPLLPLHLFPFSHLPYHGYLIFSLNFMLTRLFYFFSFSMQIIHSAINLISFSHLFPYVLLLLPFDKQLYFLLLVWNQDWWGGFYWWSRQECYSPESLHGALPPPSVSYFHRTAREDVYGAGVTRQVLCKNNFLYIRMHYCLVSPFQISYFFPCLWSCIISMHFHYYIWLNYKYFVITLIN